MKLVKCITERTSIPEQIIVDKKYWIDETTEYKDCDGDEYAEVYLDEAKKHRVGMIQTKHFETVYRYLNYGESLSNYINSHTGFLLKDIISWCLSNPTSSLANNLIMYIHDNKLDAEENMEKDFVVNSIPYKEFAKRGMQEEYIKYMGYSMYCLD